MGQRSLHAALHCHLCPEEHHIRIFRAERASTANGSWNASDGGSELSNGGSIRADCVETVSGAQEAFQANSLTLEMQLRIKVSAGPQLVSLTLTRGSPRESQR